MLQYSHCRSLSSVVHGEIKANPRYAEKDFKKAYSWLEREVGFYPLFLAVGTTYEDLRTTGYLDNSENVLFSFEEVQGVFMDFITWHIALNSRHNNYKLTDYERRLIFKYSWSKSKWLAKAKKEPGSVQLVTPKLDLTAAKRISVKSNKIKRVLTSLGFNNIEVRTTCHR